MSLHRNSTRARVPVYRLHMGSGQAVVTIEGRDIYLGTHGTDAILARSFASTTPQLSNEPGTTRIQNLI